MKQTMEAAHFNDVANDPAVRRWLGGTGPLDFGPLLADPANLAFASQHGGVVAVALGSGRYDVHTLFLEAGRGREALVTARAVAERLFTRTDAVELRTTVPHANLAARGLTQTIGFEHRFDGLLPWGDAEPIGAGFFALTLERWALMATGPEAAGRAVHAALADARWAARDPAPAHPDDPIHDRMVGAAALLIGGGQVEKGVRFYNAWACCAHYAPITLLRVHPPMLDIVDAVVTVTATGEYDVLRWGTGRAVCQLAP